MGSMFSLQNRIWLAGGVNVLAMAMQLYTTLSKQTTEGVSQPMLVIFIFGQVTFAQAGYRASAWGQFWGMTISAAISLAILALTFVY